MRLYGQTYGQIGDFEDADGKRFTWIQVFKTGSFVHPKIGDLQVDEQDLEQFVKNFQNNVHKTQPSLNLNHKREEAAGWFVGLETRKSGRELWAKIEWTDFGIEKVEKGLFRYISAELSFKHLDTETKEVSSNVLTGAALTNHPFIKGMEAVNFSEAFPNENLLLETTKDKKTMNKTELIAAFAAIGIDFNGLERKAGLYDDQTVDFQALTTSSKAVEAELSETKTKLTTATARISELEKVQIDAQFSDLVKEGMEAGKITKAYGEGDFRELFDKMGYDFAKKHLDAMPKSITTDFSGSDKGGEKGDKKGDANTAILDAAKALQVERKLDFSEAMDVLGKERPELFQAAEALADKTVGERG